MDKVIWALILVWLSAAVFMGATRYGRNTASQVLSDVYGRGSEGCIVDIDVDEGQADRIGPLTESKLYSVFCYDSSDFSGVACRFLQGDSTVDASSTELADGEGELLLAGEKTMVYVSDGYEYISFEAYQDGTTQVGVACRRN